MDERPTPYDLDLEFALLGSCLVDNSWLDVAAGIICAQDMYDPLHQRLFDMMVYFQREGAVTPITIASVMATDPGLIEVGGRDYLSSLALAATSTPNVPEYARLLLELSKRREMVRIGAELIDAANTQDRNAPAQAIADAATESLLYLNEGAKPIVSAQDIATDTLREVEEVMAGRQVPAVRTGLCKLDDEIGGIRGGDMVVVAGKSGSGKSALLGTVALNAALAGVPTIIFSLEMTAKQWVDRTVCDLDFFTEPQRSLWYSKFRTGRVTEAEFKRYFLASQRLPEKDIFEIHDDDALTVQQITSRARAFASRHRKQGGDGLGLVVIDYLQIIDPGDTRSGNREQAVNAIARGCKQLAKRLRWPVIVGSQLNEGAEQRSKEQRRPQASDVRESKGIMNEADMIWSSYRPAVAVMNSKPMDAAPGDPAWNAWRGDLTECEHRMDLLGLKNRHGRTFDIELYCDMGASAIRDRDPKSGKSTAAEEETARGLLDFVPGVR